MNPDIAKVVSGESDGCIITGDCLELMPSMPEGCVDALVTDPPYGISHSTSHGASWQNTRIAGDSDTSTRDEALRRWPVVASFGTWKTPPIAETRGTLVWDKGPAFGMGDLSFPWKPSWELIYIRGQAWTGTRDEGVLRGHIVVSWESRGRIHPHQKPISLMVAILEKLPGGDIILDPFCGSGTTCVAAKKLGRRWIGIEIDEKYAEIARRRIASTPKPLFVEQPKTPSDSPLFAETK